jgi:hypothetical protein
MVFMAIEEQMTSKCSRMERAVEIMDAVLITCNVSSNDIH